MAIVRQDKRPQAIASLAEVRRQLRGVLHTVDALQAQIEAIELDLGLANEGEQAQRDQCMVLHYPAGSDVGHVLSDCTEACVTAEDASEEAGRIIDSLEGPGADDEAQS